MLGIHDIQEDLYADLNHCIVVVMARILFKLLFTELIVEGGESGASKNFSLPKIKGQIFELFEKTSNFL